MMKRIVLFLLVCLMPVLSFADDAAEDVSDVMGELIIELQMKDMIAGDKGDSGMFHDRCEQNGAYSGKYTIDRRCYITDEQKKQFPYNAVVGVVVGWESLCTGTLVKDSADKLYVYTAAHCIKDRYSSVPVELQDGTTFSATPDVVGVGSYKYQDVAVLTIPEKNKTSLPFVKTEQFNSDDRFNVIGYGSLAILNDKTIHDVKQIYANYMNIDENKLESDNKIYEKFESELKSDKAISAKFDKFLRNHTTIFGDNKKLKGSFDCSLRNLGSVLKGKPSGSQTDCQAATGNSGGPVFDNNNNLVAVLTRGYMYEVGENSRYATTGVNGVEPVSVVQKQLYDYKLMLYHAGQDDRPPCYVETNDGDHYWVDQTLCQQAAHTKYGGDFWIGIKDGKFGEGISNCTINDTNVSILADSGPYCWCMSADESEWSLNTVFNSEQACKNSCTYACAKWFLGEKLFPW